MASKNFDFQISNYRHFEFNNFLFYLLTVKNVDLENFEKIIKIQIKNGLDINDGEFATSIAVQVLAAGDKAADTLKILSKYKIDIARTDEKGNSLFLNACQKSTKAAEYLYSQGANIFAENKAGEDALMMLAKQSTQTEDGNVPFAKLLIEKGIHPDRKIFQKTALDMALESKNKKLAEFLWSYTKNGALLSPDPHRIARAAGTGSLEIIKALEAQGADLQSKPKMEFNSPLFEAVSNGHLEVVKYLISRGVKINAEHSRNSQILFESINHPAVLKFLLTLSLDLHSKDNHGNTLLHYLAKNASIAESMSPGLFDYLLKFNLNYNAKNNAGQTPREIAIQYKNVAIIDNYIIARINPSLQKRIPIFLTTENIVTLLTYGLRKTDSHSQKQVLEDLSIEDILTAVKKLESEYGWNGVKLSEIIYDRIKRRDVGIELFRIFFSQHRDYRPENSLDLFTKATGLNYEMLKANKYSEKTLGDFFEISLGLQSGASEPIFQHSRVDPQLLTNNQLINFGHYLSRNRIVTLVSPVTAKRVFSYLPEITLEKLKEIESKRLGPIMVQAFKTLFSDPKMNFSYEQFAKLFDSWGDIEPVMTVLARYNQNELWKRNIPLLVEVFKASLNHEFADFKFGSKNPKSETQLANMSHEQVREWQKNRIRLGLAPRVTPNPRVFETLHQQVQRDLLPLVAANFRADKKMTLAREALSLKMAPRQILQKLM
ncbi:MAG: ankyrin repeat domain-containing protein, partial [Pseudobdellovibrionaceae bacterium]